jgi:hypothetical protein
MKGWQWCPGVTGRCSQCGALVKGLWKHWVGTTATLAACSDCAGGEG